MAAPWSCAVTPSWGPSKSSWSSNSSSICRRNHHHASPRQQRRFPSHPTPCSGDFRDASVDIAHFFTPVEKVGLAAIGVLSVVMVAGFGTTPGMAQSRAHVYLLRGLMNIFSLGMDTLAEKIQHRGIYATVHNYSEWQTLADHAAAAYHAGKEGPIIIIGHSLGADAVMEMSAYLGRKGVPVALA